MPWARVLLLCCALAAPAAAPDALAQVTFDEQSERLQLINAYLLDFRPGAAPLPAPEGELQVGLQATHVPDMDARVGLKKEKVEVLELIPRIRGRYVGSAGWFIGATYAPPIEIRDFQPHFLGLEAGWRLRFEALSVGLRGSATLGEAQGPITERGADDRFRFLNLGLDATVGLTLFEALTPYAGGGIGRAETRLDVDRDGARLGARDVYGYGLLGIDVAWKQLTFNFEQSFSDTFLGHFWVGVTWRF